ncbi:hypothetical protein ACFZCG_37000 [Streptomyces tanashiensis]|uniref:hypothetical protein n=1 Tax=Streptomyces tanashiensis TaxID=67367 RepID=UPI0036ED99EE
MEILGEWAERKAAFADPDGAMFTVEQSTVPARLGVGNGWKRQDATLERREGGPIGPKVAVVDVSFPQGGPGADLVSIRRDGQSVSMGWPG